MSKCKRMMMMIINQSLTIIPPTPMSFLEDTWFFHTPATTASFFIYHLLVCYIRNYVFCKMENIYQFSRKKNPNKQTTKKILHM